MVSGRSAQQVFAPLAKSRPVFKISEPIKVIHEPTDFYQTLLQGIKNARNRIFLSSLYLGSKEHELVGLLDKALVERPGLEVCVLLDCLRGTRVDSEGGSSAALLLPLVKKHGARVFLYHTPALHGVAKRLWPARYNETLGLQHIKAYVFDDEVVISGANLSRDYFTNRQDRYMLIRAKGVSDYFCGLIKTIGRFSFALSAENALGGKAYGLQMSERAFPSPSKEPKEFVRQANALVSEFLRQAETENCTDALSLSASDTMAVATVQMAQLGITQDSAHMAEFFRLTSLYASAHGCRSLMASAYFNFSDTHQSAVLHGQGRWDLLVSSPLANGFHGASGISGYIPDMYSLIEYEFLRSARKEGRKSLLAVEEYERSGWTFHGKGIWCYLDGRLPRLTMIGSPNYGYRSVFCDLEAQLTLVPGEQSSLTHDLHKEALGLLGYSQMVDEDILKKRTKDLPTWLRLLKPFIINKM
ncbi:CDP-diacylglycerol--glycerol-3-phosphate 3-phosphatidyltransferase [Coemansia sp. Benny D115]|nr:CDP-diacylglycerol--glycerol-3-phosphate 3-phosphatidyltransferase [Coemansia sp. Benny D115]